MDYWNRLGWKDRFSAPVFTQRQNAYASRFGADQVYTPQAVVNGTAQFVGSDEGALRTALARAKSPISVRFEPTSSGILKITAEGAPADADLVLARRLPTQTTRVGSGENSGRTLRHEGVVAELRLLGPAGKIV